MKEGEPNGMIKTLMPFERVQNQQEGKINTQTRRGPGSIVIWLNHWPTKPNWEAK
jgi:hypothetical protein